MKKILLVFLLTFFLFSGSLSQKNLAILFDNSGSMKQFSKEQINDAKKLVLDLVFNGIYENSIWEISGDRVNLKKIWQPSMLLYLHPFGEVVSKNEPYFRMNPEYDTRNDVNSANEFIQKMLFNKLDLIDLKTNNELAKNYAWWRISNLQNSSSSKFSFNLIMVSDGIPDVQDSIGIWLKNEFVNANSTEKTLLLFQHKNTIKKSKFILSVAYILIESEKISPLKTGIKIEQPTQGRMFSYGETINFRWTSTDKFEKYIIQIDQLNPIKKITEQEITGNQNNFNVVASKIYNNSEHQIVNATVLIKGIISNKPSAVSEQVGFKVQKEIEKKGSSRFPLWLIILLILFMGGILYYLYTNGKFDSIIKKHEKSISKTSENKNSDDKDNW